MGETVRDVGEFGLIRRIRELIEREGIRAGGVSIDIGDDTASFVPRPGYELLITCDSMVEGRHFVAPSITPFDLGSRAMTVNISDIGAMGGVPLYALVSLGLGTEVPVAYVEEMYRGFLAELNPFSASIIGGNITGSGAMFIDITLLGEVEAGKGARRAGAQQGDAILVSGYPGRSAAGLRLLLAAEGDPKVLEDPLVRTYNRPTHRASLGRALAQTGFVTAMIDTSDGFLGDLGHICEESRVGAELWKERLPLTEDLKEASRRLKHDPYDFFLGDSDDYELIITCRPEHIDMLRSAAAGCCTAPLTEVGRIRAGQGITLLHPDGRSEPLRAVSWDHFASHPTLLLTQKLARRLRSMIMMSRTIPVEKRAFLWSPVA